MKIHSESIVINFINELAQVSPTFPTKMELGETTSAKILYQETEIINCWMEITEHPKGRFAFHFIVADTHQSQC